MRPLDLIIARRSPALAIAIAALLVGLPLAASAANAAAAFAALKVRNIRAQAACDSATVTVRFELSCAAVADPPESLRVVLAASDRRWRSGWIGTTSENRRPMVCILRLADCDAPPVDMKVTVVSASGRTLARTRCRRPIPAAVFEPPAAVITTALGPAMDVNAFAPGIATVPSAIATVSVPVVPSVPVSWGRLQQTYRDALTTPALVSRSGAAAHPNAVSTSPRMVPVPMGSTGPLPWTRDSTTVGE